MSFDNRAWQRRRRVVDLILAGCLRCLALIGTCAPALAVDVPLTDRTVLQFADVREGIEALTKRDDFIASLSPFDRQVRLKADRDVSEQELLEHIARHVLPWTAGERALLTPIIESM